MFSFLEQITPGEPASDQIIQAVRRAIRNEELEAGAEFPSVRALSREYKISPTTAHKAVAVLRNSGYLAARRGKGMVVTVPELPPTAERLAELKPQLVSLVRDAAALQLTLSELTAVLRDEAKLELQLEEAAHARRLKAANKLVALGAWK